MAQDSSQDPALREKKAARWDQLVAEGKSPQEAVALVEREFGGPDASPVPEAFGNVANADPKKIAMMGLGLAGGMGVGALTAKALAKSLAPKLLGRIGVGAASGVTSGAATRAIQTEGGIGDRAKAAVDPAMMAFDATLGGALGTVLGASKGADKKAAQGLTNVIPRITRTGVPKDVGALAGITPKAPKATLKDMLTKIRGSDASRFEPVFKQYPDAITDPAVVDQWDAIRRNVGGAVADMKANKDIARESIEDVVKRVEAPTPPAAPGPTSIASQAGDEFAASLSDTPGLEEAAEAAMVEVPTLQGIQRLKESLDAAIKAGAPVAARGQTGPQAASLRSLMLAREQLKNLTFANVPGGQEYSAALAASAADRQGLSAVRSGADVLKGPQALGKAESTLDDVKASVGKYASPSSSQALKEGTVGALGSVDDPLSKLTPAMRQKIAAVLGKSGGDIDQAVAPWEQAKDVGRRLAQKSDYNISGQFGAASAAGGSIPGARLAAGALGIESLERKLALRAAQKLSPLFESRGEAPDVNDLRTILKLLAEARRRKGLISGIGAGALTSGVNTGLHEDNREP